jgi:Protein of unknown function (DUF1460)
MTSLLVAVLAVTPWSQLSDASREEEMARLAALATLRERLVAATERFVGTPYVTSPLGEGVGRDADPLVRWDAVDCVTMVEESLALSTARPGRLVETLNALRYDGPPAWENRLHVMESQWLPKNVERGHLKDVTAVYGGHAVRRVKKVLSEATWKEKGGAGLALPKNKQTVGTWELPIIPSASAVDTLSRAPAGLVVVVVRADRPTQVTRVSHVGVLIQSPKGPLLRHASRTFKKVVDEPLARYLHRNLDFAKWTIEGLAVFEPTL